jgi:hypothetical protein
MTEEWGGWVRIDTDGTPGMKEPGIAEWIAIPGKERQ